MLETATGQLHEWQRRYGLPELSMSVNVSVCQLGRPGFANDVKNILLSTGIDPASLVLEVSETILADPDGAAAAALADLCLAGVRVALDIIPVGIEELEYFSLLQAMGCHLGQGFMLARPIPADAIDALLAAQLPLRHTRLEAPIHRAPRVSNHERVPALSHR